VAAYRLVQHLVAIAEREPGQAPPHLGMVVEDLGRQRLAIAVNERGWQMHGVRRDWGREVRLSKPSH
jgi:hypothetical protein